MNPSELVNIISNAWQKYTDKDNAVFIADSIVETALHKDQRINPIKGNLHDLQSFKASKNRQLEIRRVSEGFTVCDFQGNPAIAFLKQIVEMVVEKTRSAGASTTALRNTSGMHELSTWVYPFALNDLVAYFRWNGGSYTTVPFGSKQSFFGTNPLAYAIPTSKAPILCDMSTSEIPYLQLNYSRRNKLPLGPRQGLDAFGHETTDPDEVYNPKHNEDVRLLPLGAGPKGSAIMLFGEIMTGAFVGAKMAREASDEPLIPEEFGGLLHCYDPDAVTDSATFKAAVSQMADQIRRSEVAHGHERVCLPGDLSYSRAEEKRENGFEISADIVDEFRNI